MELTWHDVLMFYRGHEVAVDMAVGVISVCTIGLLIDSMTSHEGWLLALPRRRGRMIRKQRWEYVKNLATYDFTDKIEERVYQGALTRKEAQELYRMMKSLFPVRGMFPSPQMLKENIKKRLKNGDHAPVPLPPDTPASEKKGAKFTKA